jgi:hypothetical protein
MKTGYRMKATSLRDYLQRIRLRHRHPPRGRNSTFWMNSVPIVATVAGTPFACSMVRRQKPSRYGCERAPRRVSYGARVISILEAVWEAADYPWSLCLKALLPRWMPWIRQHFRLTAKIEEQLLRISLGRSITTFDLASECYGRISMEVRTRDFAETAASGEDRSLGRPGAGSHGDRFGIAFRCVGGRRLLPFVEPDRHLQHLSGNPRGAGKGAGWCAAGAGRNTPIPLHLFPKERRNRW